MRGADVPKELFNCVVRKFEPVARGRFSDKATTPSQNFMFIYNLILVESVGVVWHRYDFTQILSVEIRVRY